MKKRINIRLHEEDLTVIDDYCKRHNKTRTAFLEYGIKLAVKELKMYKPKPRPKRYWHGSIETMPLHSTRKQW